MMQCVTVWRLDFSIILYLNLISQICQYCCVSILHYMRIWLATSEVGNKSHKIEQNMCEENKGALTMKLDVIDMNRKRLRINAVDKRCELQ